MKSKSFKNNKISIRAKSEPKGTSDRTLISFVFFIKKTPVFYFIYKIKTKIIKGWKYNIKTF